MNQHLALYEKLLLEPKMEIGSIRHQSIEELANSWVTIFMSPLNCKEIKPINPKRNQPENSLEGLMLKLKLQYFGHLKPRADSLKKTLILGKIEGRRRRGWQRMRRLDGITKSMDMSVNKL